MSEQIRNRTLSPVELVSAHLKQIEKHNPAINAFVATFPEQALEAARRAEQQPANGPLHGIPITIKDSFDLAGEPTLCGSRYRLGHRAAADSTAAARFRAAGAIPIGKTNCPEFLANYETDNSITGRTNNPWDLTRSPGGSSGGESAAISSFMSAGGIGSDGGGSVRIPAHFTGITALKPTPGRVSAAGHYPQISHPGGLLGVAGPMARTAADLRILFEVLSGYDPADPFSAPVPLRAPNLDNLRIGVMEQFYQVPVQEPLKAAVRKAAAALRDLKFSVDEFTPKGLERSPNLWWFFFGELPAPFTRQIIATDPAKAHWTGTEFVNSVPADQICSVKLVENLAARDAMRAALLRQMEHYPVILLPPCGVTAFLHRERYWNTASKSIGLFEAMMPVTPFNLLGLPSVVIPFDMTDDGLPVGIQLVGRPYDEETLLELAVLLESSATTRFAPKGF
jgi:Asp-tRNA(Asn)/Glu-tRNA(Gln) amidotransferase A subunit family amidase